MDNDEEEIENAESFLNNIKNDVERIKTIRDYPPDEFFNKIEPDIMFTCQHGYQLYCFDGNLDFEECGCVEPFDELFEKLTDAKFYDYRLIHFEDVRLLKRSFDSMKRQIGLLETTLDMIKNNKRRRV